MASGMASIGERVTHVEVKVDIFRSDVAELKGLIVALDERMDRRFVALDERMDRRFQAVDHRFDAADRRFVEQQERMDRRFDAVDRRFYWNIGLQVMILLTIIGGLFGLLAQLR